MHAEKYWDHDAFFSYVDRWMTEDDTQFLKIIQEQTKFRSLSRHRTDLSGLVLAKADLGSIRDGNVAEIPQQHSGGPEWRENPAGGDDLEIGRVLPDPAEVMPRLFHGHAP